MKKKLKKGVLTLATVKADAYGHGAVGVAVHIQSMVDYFGIAELGEAVELRSAGVEKPILVLSYTSPYQYETLIENELTQTIFNYDDAVALSAAAVKLNKIARVHIAIDTGMSRIGRMPIAVPAGVTVEIAENNKVTVKGPKGTLVKELHSAMDIAVEGNEIVVTRPNDEKENRSKHGLYRALIYNMVYGVSEGYKKVLQLHGVGYRVELTQPQLLNFSLGYTHPIYLLLPKEVKVETKSERNQDPLIILESADKQLIGQVCAKIRSFRKPEPYKGKGILFQGEVVRRKAGKSASK